MLLTRSQMGFAISTNELEETGGVLTNGSAAACVSPAQRVTGETQGGERTRRKGCGPGGTETLKTGWVFKELLISFWFK